jgi:membrane associated rhomboid family serine protease
MAYLQSQPPREPFLHAPASLLWLIAAIVAAHVARILAPAQISDAILMQYSFVPARYEHAGAVLALAVPFVSHMFLHADFVHLGVNCVWLLAFGAVVARRFGPTLFLTFFATCGIIGAATYLAFNWGSPEGVIGASGAISGLMGAAIRMMPWPGAARTLPLAPILSRPVLVFSLFWLVANFVFGFTGFGASGEIHQIAWQAHLGGYIAGLLLAEIFDGLRRPHVADTIPAR